MNDLGPLILVIEDEAAMRRVSRSRATATAGSRPPARATDSHKRRSATPTSSCSISGYPTRTGWR